MVADAVRKGFGNPYRCTIEPFQIVSHGHHHSPLPTRAPISVPHCGMCGGDGDGSLPSSRAQASTGTKPSDFHIQ